MWGLGSIGGFLGNVGKTIGGGIAKGAKTVGSNIKDRFTQMGGMDDAMGGGKAVPMTPGFNPNAPTPAISARPWYANPQNQIKKIADIGGSKSNAGVSAGEPPSLPMPALDMKPPMPLTPTQQSGHPPLTGFDTDTGRMAGSPPPKPMPPLTGVNPMSGQLDAASIPTIRDSVEITDTAPRLAPSPAPPMLDRPPAQLPQDPSRKDIPIPALPNRGYDPTPYNDYDAARYDYTMKHAKRDAEGNFAPGGGFERNWKSMLQNALAGAANYADTGDWGKMLGGAIGGGAGAAVNPQRGYEIAFDRGHGAHMQQAQGMRDARTEQERKQRMGDLQIENIESQIGSRRSQAETARMNAERQQAVAESQIKYNEARAQAQMRGTPVKVDLVNEKTGAIESVQIYPDGTRSVLGLSGDAAIRGATLESQAYRDSLNRDSREREGALNRQSRENIAQMPARARGGTNGVPDDARKEFIRVDRLKKDADELFRKAQAGQGDLQSAYDALENANKQIQDFGQVYGDYYEVGKGDKGWWYAKEKPRSAPSLPTPGQPRAAVAPDFVDRVMNKLGISREEAIRRIQGNGIEVR